MGARRVEHVMGTAVVADIRDDGAWEVALDGLFEWLRFVDATFSTYREDSQISRLNRGELRPGDAHPDVGEVLARCAELREQTAGYFDAGATGDGVDPSGLVKGWSIERGARLLERAGCSNFAVNAGGDIVVRGGALPEEAWRVGIQHPTRPGAVSTLLAVSDLAIATSGDYERGGHVLDPFTRRPARGLLSVTLVGPDLGTGDAYATAAFAMGARGPHWTARLPRGYEAMSILVDGTVLATPGFGALEAG